MFPQRNALRLSQRAAQQLRAAPVRSTVQRRLNSSDSKLPSWAADNEFNREREAVKHHAAATSGAYLDQLMPWFFKGVVVLTQWLVFLLQTCGASSPSSMWN